MEKLEQLKNFKEGLKTHINNCCFHIYNNEGEPVPVVASADIIFKTQTGAYFSLYQGDAMRYGGDIQVAFYIVASSKKTIKRVINYMGLACDSDHISSWSYGIKDYVTYEPRFKLFSYCFFLTDERAFVEKYGAYNGYNMAENQIKKNKNNVKKFLNSDYIKKLSDVELLYLELED